ncbi:MAG: hypothetical protein KAR20_23310, partial [Candidatus Heimdallarchaeota archaeon]|nr:hypothetical protein [Candidatus Heimdallarchaeota archaeon]
MTRSSENQNNGFSSIPAIKYDRSDSRRRQTRTMYSGNFFLFLAVILLLVYRQYYYVFIPLILLILYLMQKMG